MSLPSRRLLRAVYVLRDAGGLPSRELARAGVKGKKGVRPPLPAGPDLVAGGVGLRALDRGKGKGRARVIGNRRGVGPAPDVRNRRMALVPPSAIRRGIPCNASQPPDKYAVASENARGWGRDPVGPRPLWCEGPAATEGGGAAAGPRSLPCIVTLSSLTVVGCR